MRTLVNRFCKPVDIKLVFSTFKIKNLFKRESILSLIGSVRALYINFPVQVVMLVTSVKQADTSLRASESTYRRTDLRHIFKHLQSSESCRISFSADCFTVLDSATTKFQVKLKESMYIKWEKPDLNQQVKHINLMLSS